MEKQKSKCPRCSNETPDNVLYQCCRCFTKYCGACDDANSGKNCPQCGMGARIVLDQGDSKKAAA